MNFKLYLQYAHHGTQVNAEDGLKVRVHRVIDNHFPSKAQAYMWLKKVTGKHHVADCTREDCQKALKEAKKKFKYVW